MFEEDLILEYSTTLIDKTGLAFRGYLKDKKYFLEVTRELRKGETVEEWKEKIPKAIACLETVEHEMEKIRKYIDKLNDFWADSDRCSVYDNDIQLKDESLYRMLERLSNGEKKE